LISRPLVSDAECAPPHCSDIRNLKLRHYRTLPSCAASPAPGISFDPLEPAPSPRRANMPLWRPLRRRRDRRRTQLFQTVDPRRRPTLPPMHGSRRSTRPLASRRAIAAPDAATLY
jgi:hypothetical protein